MLQLFTLLFLILFTVVRCKPDYIYNTEVDGWFKLHIIPATWKEAFLRCHYEGAVLASPINDEMATALHTVITKADINQYIFLGTHALLSSGDYSSVEGVPLADMPIKWSDYMTAGDCLAMNIYEGISYVHTALSTDRYPYVCYKARGNNTKLNECNTYDNKYILNRYTGSCYKVHDEKQKWSRAQMICSAEGGYLVIINNNEEANIVKGLFPYRPNPDNWEAMHIGLRNWDQSQTWFTIHGESINDVFKSWAAGQPDNSNNNEYCGTFIRAGVLNDNVCETRFIFVCEKNPDDARYEALPHDIKTFNV